MRLLRIDRDVSWQGVVTVRAHVYEQRLRVVSFEVDMAEVDSIRAVVKDLLSRSLSELRATE